MMTAKFCGVDFWSAAIFKTDNGHFFCCTDLLIGGSKEERAQQLRTIIDGVNSGNMSITYKGRDFDGEPIGSVNGVTLTSDVEFP